MKAIILRSIRGTLACALVLGLLQPFGIDQMREGRLWFILGQSACVFVCSIFCDYVTGKAFPTLYANRSVSTWGVVKLMLPSFVLLTLILPVLLLTFNCWFNERHLFTYWFNEEGFTLSPYFTFLPLVAMVSVVIFMGMFFVVRSNVLKDELEELRELNRLLEQQQETEQDEEPTEEEPKCRLVSSTNNLSLEVAPKDIIYIESMANYADVCYMEEGETHHMTLRITMKQLRESLAEIDYLVSCHRAFIVNIHFIVAVAPRPSGGYQLQIFGQEMQIPVSRTFTDEIRRRTKEPLVHANCDPHSHNTTVTSRSSVKSSEATC